MAGRTDPRLIVRARSAVTALTVAIVVAACTQSPQATPNPTAGTAGAWQPETAWQRALGAIGADGQYSLQAALDLFATAFGPLPGTTAEQDLRGIEDLTIAVDAVMAHEAELTSEQRTAIETYLAPSPDAITIEIGPSAQSGVAPALAVMPGNARTVQLAGVTDELKAQLIASGNGYRDAIAQGLNMSIPGFTIVYEPRPDDIEPAAPGIYPHAMARGIYDANEQNVGCQVVIFDESAGQADQVLKSVLAHEIFHCFQYRAYGTKQKMYEAPTWVIEGQASWAGQTVGGVSGTYNHFWNEYLQVPTKPLTTRTYDAIGFYGHLQRQFEVFGASPAEAVGQMWAPLKAMWAAGADSAAAFEASGAGEAAFLESWASGVTRLATRGVDWDTSGIGITTSAYAPPAVALPAGTPVDVGQDAFTNDVWNFQLNNVDMVHFDIDGPARLHDGSMSTTALHGVWYCVAGHECDPQAVCPDAAPAPAIAGTISGAGLLAVSGGSSGTDGTVFGIDIDACESLPPPSLGPAPSGFKTATANVTAGVGLLTGGWCDVDAAFGTNYFQLWFVGPDKDFFDISVGSSGPITAGAYNREAHDIISTIRHGDFYFNLKLQVVTVTGTGGDGGFKPTGGSFSGTYWDEGAKNISGRFNCAGATAEFDYAIGSLNFSAEIPDEGMQTISVSVTANSEADGSFPNGYVQLTRFSDLNNPHVWAIVECLTVSGSTAGIVARTTSALSKEEAALLPPEANVPAGSLIYIGGRQDDDPDLDQTVFRVVNSATTCLPTAFALDHEASAFQTHDAP